MTVTLRQRKKGEKISLYLDYYEKGTRKYEYLRLYLISNPKTRDDRTHNKKTKELAETIRAKRQLEVQEGKYCYVRTELLNSSFTNYMQKLAEKRFDSAGNYGNWMASLQHVKKFAEDKPLKFKDVNAYWLVGFKSYLLHDARTKNNNRLSQNSCLSYFNKVRATLKQAIKDGILSKNPASDVESIKEPETQRQFLTLDEVKSLVQTECKSPVLKKAFLFGCLTGLRFSDIKNLTWSQVQFSNENGFFIRFAQQKTKGQETLPISKEAVGLLGEPQNFNDAVFAGLVYNNDTNVTLRSWLDKAGINKEITFHCSRHTYATLQLSLGTDIYTVSKMLGHKNLKTTQVYAKIIDAQKIKAANRIKLGING